MCPLDFECMWRAPVCTLIISFEQRMQVPVPTLVPVVVDLSHPIYRHLQGSRVARLALPLGGSLGHRRWRGWQLISRLRRRVHDALKEKGTQWRKLDTNNVKSVSLPLGTPLGREHLTLANPVIV